MAGIVTQASDPSTYAATIAGGVIPRGHVRLSCGDPPFALVALLGPEAPTLSGGFGGWQVVARPRDVGMTIWEGVEPYQLTLSLMLDGYNEGHSQEPALRGLSRVARGDNESPPGVLTIDGIPLPVERWVIEGIDFGDPIRRLGDASRVRQALTITLREYVPPSYLRRRISPYASSSKAVIIRAQKGDTPAKIAKRRRLKSWTVLRDLNRSLISKANQKLKTGTKIRVPATKTAARSGGKDKRKK